MRRLSALVVAGAALWLAPGAFAAGWCGTGESAVDRPEAVTGQQVHLVYAVPADGADNFVTASNRMADDVTSITTWWTGQDATRAPRFDLAAFPGGTCVDISVVRLPESAAALTGSASAAFSRVANDLFSNGFGNAFKRYVVYYDGPSVQNGVCGTGAGDFKDGPGYAVVWLNGCQSAPSDAVAVHELAHALGAVPSGAPHECPPPHEMHVCDSTLDLLYWLDSGQPLASRFLDFNHDDYYGFATNGIDVRQSLLLRRLDAPQQPLGIAISGTGSVESDVPGIACSAACSTLWDQGWTFDLSPSPGAGQRFVRWTGACAGDGSCSLLMTQPQAVTAVFGPLTIPLKVTTAGRGRVACTPACTKTFSAGDPLTLRAVPAKGWRFTGWSGGCKGTRLVCKPPTDFALTVRATFRKR